MGTSGGYSVYDGRDTFYSALAEFIGDRDNVRLLADIAYMDDGTIEVITANIHRNIVNRLRQGG